MAYLYLVWPITENDHQGDRRRVDLRAGDCGRFRVALAEIDELG